MCVFVCLCACVFDRMYMCVSVCANFACALLIAWLCVVVIVCLDVYIYI